MALVPKQIHQLLNIAWYIWCSYSLERGALGKGFVVACRHQAPPNKSCSAAGSAHCLSVVMLLCGHQELGLKGYKPSWLDCVYSRRITLKPLASVVKILVQICRKPATFLKEDLSVFLYLLLSSPWGLWLHPLMSVFHHSQFHSGFQVNFSTDFLSDSCPRREIDSGSYKHVFFFCVRYLSC